MSLLVPKLAARRRMLKSSAVYQTSAVPHLLDPMPRAVVVPRGAPEAFVERRTRQEINAARRDEGGRTR